MREPKQYAMDAIMVLATKQNTQQLDSMRRILEKYHRATEDNLGSGIGNKDCAKYWKQEATRTRHQLSLLGNSLRRLTGEDLESLTLKELEKLELKLNNAISQVHTKKIQVMCEHIGDLQRKDDMLMQENITLRAKLEAMTAGRFPSPLAAVVSPCCRQQGIISPKPSFQTFSLQEQDEVEKIKDHASTSVETCLHLGLDLFPQNSSS